MILTDGVTVSGPLNCRAALLLFTFLT